MNGLSEVDTIEVDRGGGGGRGEREAVATTMDRSDLHQPTFDKRAQSSGPPMKTIHEVATRVLLWLGAAGSLTPELQEEVHTFPVSRGKYLEAAIQKTYPPC